METKNELIKNLIEDGYLKTPNIIEAFRAIDRADFVLPEYRSEAYGNYPLPITGGQTISQPLTVAFMLELLEPQLGEKILDIGAGSGWQTTLLAEIIGAIGVIVAIERIPELCDFAQKNIDKYGFIKNRRVKFYCQDATREIPEGPYDKIIAAASASKEIPEIWRKNLKINGRIVAPIGGSIWLFIKRRRTKDEGQTDIYWEEKEFPGFLFVPLVNPVRSSRGALSPAFAKTERHSSPRQAAGYSASNGVNNHQPLTINHQQKRQPPLNKSLFTVQKLFITFLVFSFLAFGLFANEIYLPHTSFRGSKSILIPFGWGARQIAEILKKEGIIRSKWTFIIYISLKRQSSGLKPGDYVFYRSSIKELTNDLIRGGTNEKSITIPEGWAIKDIAEYLEKENIVSKTEFEKLTNKTGVKIFAPDFYFLKDKPVDRGLEGYLFPDTYRIFKDAESEDIVKKMLENFDKKLNPELKAEIAKQKKSVFEIITMASLIEREIISDEDRAIVSGILWKRLENNIGLQVDATINYIKRQKTKDEGQEANEKISIADTKIDSPYNTYKYRGLPFGPIANPGLSAIKAAIYPKSSPYFYYLSALDGKTIFSKTLEEHNEAKMKYLK